MCLKIIINIDKPAIIIILYIYTIIKQGYMEV